MTAPRLTQPLPMWERERMTLIQYLETHNLTYQQFGQQLGVGKSAVWRWANAKRLPDLRTALEIERLTAGAVKPEDWRQ